MPRFTRVLPVLGGLLLLTACAGGGGGTVGAGGGSTPALDGFPAGVAEVLVAGELAPVPNAPYWNADNGSGGINVFAASGATDAALADEALAAFDAGGLVQVANASDSEFAPGVPGLGTFAGEGFVISAVESASVTSSSGQPSLAYAVTQTGLSASTFTEYDEALLPVVPEKGLLDYGDYWSLQYTATRPASDDYCAAPLLEVDAALKAAGLQPEASGGTVYYEAYFPLVYGDIEVLCQDSASGDGGWQVDVTVDIPKV